MSHTIKIVLPDPAMNCLDRLAASADMRTATIASRLLQSAIGEVAEGGRLAPLHAPVKSHQGSERAPWLEPYGGSPDWRKNTWAAIVALHGRYPRHLEHLKDHWWTDHAQTETLAALAHWRRELDDTATDPRQELAFQTQLNDYAQQLRQQGSGTAKTWTPGGQPGGWIGEEGSHGF
jgi:hypothetical protein